MITEQLTLVTTQDNEQIALWKVVDDNVTLKGQKAQNVFLTHGTFSDKRACLRIASYLAELGHHCYIMEWRGHGSSPAPKTKFNFETIATYDIAATLRYLFEDLALDHLHSVTHSGGGACLAMCLIQQPQYIKRFSSVTLFACQTYGAITSPKSYAKILSAKLITRLFGFIPARRLGLGPVNESYYTMCQWYDWNLNKNFKSSFIKVSDMTKEVDHTDVGRISTDQDARFDYRLHLSKISTPIYAISAKGDTFISPTSGCRQLFDNFQTNQDAKENNDSKNNSTNLFREYALANGDLEDYDHTRILMSRNAAAEIWPTVAAWIDKHASHECPK